VRGREPRRNAGAGPASTASAIQALSRDRLAVPNALVDALVDPLIVDAAAVTTAKGRWPGRAADDRGHGAGWLARWRIGRGCREPARGPLAIVARRVLRRGEARAPARRALRRRPGGRCSTLRSAALIDLQREMARARRSDGRLVLAFVDVDGLKAVNDVRGHADGDALLGDVAVALRTALRSYDLVVRYGGDEFLCALPGTDIEGARRRFEEVARRLTERAEAASVSVGLAALERTRRSPPPVGSGFRTWAPRRDSVCGRVSALVGALPHK
jgi:diguanylate cyclase (GGDEF)-like protein